MGGITKPTRAEVAAAVGRTIADVLAPGLDVIFCGINPGLSSGAVGHHFARPGNPFWKALHLGGFTDRVLEPREERELLRYGCGLTNLVARATARASDLELDELRAGAERLADVAARYRPRIVAILGIGAYRAGFREPRAEISPTTRTLGRAAVWVLPNPSGLNAHHQLDDLGERFAALRRAARQDQR
ncbi:MAG: G/U mismatch-specific DNA glycosylase [Actinomycetota bacterium]